MDKEIIARAAQIRLVAFDVDGVMSDGRITYSSGGGELKSFNIKDGLGIKLLQGDNIEVAIITGRESKAVSKRANELGIKTVIQGRSDKLKALTELTKKRKLSLEECAYMGDDLPDLSAIMAAGIGACPADAVAEVASRADWTSRCNGGSGAVREFCEFILRARGDWAAVVWEYEH
jgi:3-deoxy-D-manno-octulosonate 8-phosphate phosphatase (KDO 8-P phosphatase)